MNFKYVYISLLIFFFSSCGNNDADEKTNTINEKPPTLSSKIIGTYDVIMREEINSFLSITLKDDGTGFLKNTEMNQYTNTDEFCRFNYVIKLEPYKIKDGKFNYISLNMKKDVLPNF